MSMKDKPKWKRLKAVLVDCKLEVFTAEELMFLSQERFNRLYLDTNQIGSMLRILKDGDPAVVEYLGKGKWRKVEGFTSGS